MGAPRRPNGLANEHVLGLRFCWEADPPAVKSCLTAWEQSNIDRFGVVTLLDSSTVLHAVRKRSTGTPSGLTLARINPRHILFIANAD